jgi:hypothetical protein
VVYEGVSKRFLTGRLEVREQQMVQLSATRRSCIVNLRVSLVNFVAITICVASQRVSIVIVVYFVMTLSGNFRIHLCIYRTQAWFGRGGKNPVPSGIEPQSSSPYPLY